MFKNYFKIAIRSLWRNRAYTFINVLGLAIGITGAVLLLTFVQDEYAFESNHENIERIVRPVLVQTNTEELRYYGGNPLVTATTLVDELPEVEAQTYMTQFLGGQFNLRINNERYTERKYAVTDNDHFKVFSYDFIHGNPDDALLNPFEIVISESKSMALFGKTNVLNELVEAPNIGQFKVVGVFKDQPQNTHIDLDMMISPSFPGERWNTLETSWTSFGGASYLLLAEGVSYESFLEKADEVIKTRMPEFLSEMVRYEFQPLADIHFNSAHIERDIADNKGDKSYTTIFIVISTFLILIACVNYMNLATSKAVFRAKEIGIRKVAGAVKSQLIVQFLMESLLITSIAMLLSIGLLDLIMPYFNSLTNKSFVFNWQTLTNYLPMLMSITILVAMLSGLYPAFFMTRMQTVNILKGEQVSGGSFNIRKALVVFQFVLGIFMIISTLIVGNQMDYIKEKSLGFDQSNLIVIDINNGAVRPVFKTMRNELNAIPGVEQVSVTSRVPGEWKNINESEIGWTKENEIDSSTVYYMSFDEHALDVFGIELTQGEFFRGNDAGDSTKVLINEAAANLLGFDNPIGEFVTMNTRAGEANFQIIGMVKDFHFQSLHSQIEPMVIGAWNNDNSIIDYFTLRYSGDPESIIEAAGLVHQKFDNRTVMEYHFLDQQLEVFYENERQANVIFKIGAGLSIFIACLGLFGLASFTIQKRVKELGIRKVLGASEWTLFYLLSGSFIKQVLLAFLLASPLAYFMMQNWLNNFQYKVPIGAGVFLITILIIVLITLVTVSYRSFKAASTNPVNSLRSE